MANQAVYGIVSNRANAERTIQALVDAGVRPQDISFLSAQGNDFREFSTTHIESAESNRNWRTEERVTDYPASTTRRNGRQDTGELGTEKHSKAPEGTAAGAVTGGIIGGTLGLLAGIGALAIPGLGPFIAAGPLMATLAGIGSGGTLGGLIGALAGAGIPEFEAKRYESHLKKGGILLAIRANNDDRAQQIKDILEQHGAQDVSISSEATTSKNHRNK